MQLFVHLLLLLLFSHFIACQRIDPVAKPSNYDLVLLPMIHGDNPRLCGHVIIDLEMTTTTNLLTLNSYELNLLDVILLSSNTTRETQFRLEKVRDLCFSGLLVSDEVSDEMSDEWVELIQEDVDKQQVTIIFKRPLYKNTRYRIGLAYTGKVNDEAEGFFRVNYKSDPETCCPDGWFGGTQMEVAHARKVFPCFDEPSFKATFDITIGHERSLSALSNMPQTDTSEMQNNPDWRWTKFSKSPLMSTYLLAMFLTDYKFVERIYKSCNRFVRIRFWGKPNQIPHLKQIIPIVPKMMHHMETYLKQTYSLPKLDFIAPPIKLVFAGMENWGLIVISEKELFHNEQTDSQTDLLEDLQTMGHEIAHQFFGNLVTSDWWTDIWFNEGLSSAFQYELVKQSAPDLVNEAELKWMSTAQMSMNNEEFQKRVPIIRPAETVKEAEEIFDSLTYVKANALFYMLRNFVGHQNFREALITYMERYKFKNANSKQFIQIVNEKIHKFREIGLELNINSILDSWTKQPSYPIINCTRLDNGRIKLSQISQAQIDPSNNSTNKNFTWWIPIAMTDARRPDFSPEGTFPRVWLTPQRPILQISYFPSGFYASNNESDHWIIINGQFASYARVLYDEFNWQLIARQLITNHTAISQITRYRLIDDAFTLAYFDLMKYQTVFHLVEYLTMTSDDFVKSLVNTHLKFMKTRAKKDQILCRFFEDYIERLAKTYPESLNILTRSSATITKCKKWEDGLCVDEALRIFNALLDDTITPDEQRVMTKDFEQYWCVAIHSGGENEWKRAWQASKDGRWTSQRTKILSAMSCSRDRNHLKQLLSRVFYSTIDQNKKDTFVLLEKMAANPTGRSMVLNFIKNNWDFLEQNFEKSDDTVKLLTSVSKHLSTTEELDEVSRLLASREKKEKDADPSITLSILNGIRRNIRWVEKRTDELYKLIESKKSK